MEAMFSWLQSAAFALRSALGYTAHAYTRLYSDDVDGVLVCGDASLVSLLRLEGSLQLLGEVEFADLVRHLNTVLAVPLGKSCHSLQIVFNYDPRAICIWIYRQSSTTGKRKSQASKRERTSTWLSGQDPGRLAGRSGKGSEANLPATGFVGKAAFRANLVCLRPSEIAISLRSESLWNAWQKNRCLCVCVRQRRR